MRARQRDEDEGRGIPHGANVSAAPWDPMPSRDWASIRTSIDGKWPEGLMRHDLRWWASRVRCGLDASVPSSRVLAETWGVGRAVARRVMRAEELWADPKFYRPTTSPAPTQQRPTADPADPVVADVPDADQPTTDPGPTQDRPTTSHRRGVAQPQSTEHKNNTGPGKPGPASLASLKWTSNTPRTIDRAQLATTCLRIAAAITGRPCEAIGAEGTGRDIAPRSAKTLAAPILSLLRALDWPDLATFEADALLLASAAQRCPEPLFARSLRAEGWPEGTDRSRSVRTLMVQEAWDERVEAARAWSGPTPADLADLDTPADPDAWVAERLPGLMEAWTRASTENPQNPNGPMERMLKQRVTNHRDVGAAFWRARKQAEREQPRGAR